MYKMNVYQRILFSLSYVPHYMMHTSLSIFLFYYYQEFLTINQVSFIFFIALIWDSISDLFVGYWSDCTRSKFGRRHPFMLISIIPFSVLFYYVYNPPVLTFYFCLVILLLLRTSSTLFEIPCVSLSPELSEDYNLRTNLLGSRVSISTFVSWIFIIFFQHHNQHNLLGIVGGIVIFMITFFNDRTYLD